MKELTKEFLEKIIEAPEAYRWDIISRSILQEEFIDKYADKVDWYYISKCQKLSEEFIENHFDKVNWENISAVQKLSEKFIEKHSDKVDWYYISANQKLSEEFMEKHSDKINWLYISSNQKLSEEFIEKYSDKVYWPNISKYQKLSPEFIKKHNLTIPNTCWLYKDKEFKRKYILENTNCEIIGDKIIAYKLCRRDGYPLFCFHNKYEVGGEYETHADHNIDEENSFGLSTWTKEGAIKYGACGKLFKVEIDLNDIAAIVRYNTLIRVTKMKIIEDFKYS